MGIAKRIIRYRINSWFLSSQLGTIGHTLRDKSQAAGRKRYSKDSVLMDFWQKWLLLMQK